MDWGRLIILNTDSAKVILWAIVKAVIVLIIFNIPVTRNKSPRINKIWSIPLNKCSTPKFKYATGKLDISYGISILVCLLVTRVSNISLFFHLPNVFTVEIFYS